MTDSDRPERERPPHTIDYPGATDEVADASIAYLNEHDDDTRTRNLVTAAGVRGLANHRPANRSP